MKQIINFKRKQGGIEEFPYVTLLIDREVFLELPICAIEFGVDYIKPVLYGDHNGVPTVYEHDAVVELLSKLKIFYLKNDQGKLTEVSKGEADVTIRLPKDTNVDQLVYDRGQIFLAKPINEEVTENGINN